MKIEHFGGFVECNGIEEFESILNMRYGKGVNEFWVCGKDRYPCLSVMVNGEYAYVHFFPEHKHPGFHSVSINTRLPEGKTSVFYTGTIYEEIQISNDAVIPFSFAVTAAKEFFNTLKMPKCIEWFEL